MSVPIADRTVCPSCHREYVAMFRGDQCQYCLGRKHLLLYLISSQAPRSDSCPKGHWDTSLNSTCWECGYRAGKRRVVHSLQRILRKEAGL